MLNNDMLHNIVLDGARKELGMPGFPQLNKEDLTAVQHFIRREARKEGLAPQ